MEKKSNHPKRLAHWVKCHKAVVFLAVIILLIILSFYGTKLVLYFKLLLGNDIIVKLDVDKSNLYLVHGEKEKIEFEAKVMTNPFCTAVCEYEFKDISADNLLDAESFILKPGSPLKKDYWVEPPELGKGLYLYRFDLDCRSKRTLLCYTREKPSTRSILVTMNYGLTDEEKELKGEMEEKLNSMIGRIGLLMGEQDSFENISTALNRTLIYDSGDEDTRGYAEGLILQMDGLKSIWEKEDYYLLSLEAASVDNRIGEIEKVFADKRDSLAADVSGYNELIDQFSVLSDYLERISALSITNKTTAAYINTSIYGFNDAAQIINKRTGLDRKTEAGKNITLKIEALKDNVERNLRLEVLARELDIIISYDALCRIGGKCLINISVSELANLSDLELSDTCGRVDKLDGIMALINDSVADDVKNYPSAQEFWSNITLMVKDIKLDVIESYLAELPDNRSNSGTIREILSGYLADNISLHPEENLTSALLYELTKQSPKPCTVLNTTFPEISRTEVMRIDMPSVQEADLNIPFEEPA
ncbi:hypothetical protein KY366_06845, partial [Candidatus Woesearchaeota archaeon]|nr:hypothetical protein [Candidatus Woesearchaeota archaeon]